MASSCVPWYSIFTRNPFSSTLTPEEQMCLVKENKEAIQGVVDVFQNQQNVTADQYQKVQDFANDQIAHVESDVQDIAKSRGCNYDLTTFGLPCFDTGEAMFSFLLKWGGIAVGIVVGLYLLALFGPLLARPRS